MLLACSENIVPESSAANVPQAQQADRHEERDSTCREPLSHEDPDPFTSGSHERFGGPNEEDDMWVEPIQQLLYEEMVERSGGMWVDQARGEVIVMLTAPAPDGESVAAASDKELLERLRAASQYPGAVVCMHATYTQVELEALVDDAMTRLNSPRSGSVDVVHNGVTIRLEIDEQTAHEVLGDLAEHPAVKVEVPECARVEEPPAGAVLLPGGGSNCYSRLAAASGTLGGDASAGCVWLEGDEGRRTPLAFPQGWSITSDGTIHNQLAEPVARLGDPVNAGGGYTEIELPEPCQTGHGAFQIGGMQPS